MKKKLQLILAASVLAAGITQASLVVTIDSYDTGTGALTLTVKGTVSALSDKDTWSNNRIILGQKGVDWVTNPYGANPSVNPVTPNITPHNTNDGSHYYGLNDDDYYAVGEDKMVIQFDNAFAIGEAVDFTWSGGVSTAAADLSLLTDPIVWVGATTEVIPEPSVLILSSVFGAGIFGVRRFFLI